MNNKNPGTKKNFFYHYGFPNASFVLSELLRFFVFQFKHHTYCTVRIKQGQTVRKTALKIERERTKEKSKSEIKLKI